VPLRFVAEALGTDVKWNEKQRTVNINSANSDSSQQLTLLQQGFAAKTPKEAVQTWAEAVQNRNGAVQFAVLSPALKEKIRSHYEQIHWVTGISSPWVDEFYITKEEKSADNTWKYGVEFQMKTSTGNAGLESASLKVAEMDGSWYITEVLGGTDGVPNAIPDDIHTKDGKVQSLVARMKIGLTKSEISKLIGDKYVEVENAMDGSTMWRYDFAVKDGYVYKATVIDSKEIDQVDSTGLEVGSLHMQLFVGFWDAGTVRDYSLYYKGQDGKIYNYRLYGDGRIQIK